MLDYPVTLVSDDSGVMATFVDVPEAITFGADEEEALLQASDALVAGLSFYVDDRKLLPNASKPKSGQKTVSPALGQSLKLMLYQAMQQKGVKKAALARFLNWNMPQVDRLLNIKHESRRKNLIMTTQLTEAEIKHRLQNMNFAIANNELSGYVVTDADKQELERYVLGEITLAEILAKWKKEDRVMIEKLQTIAAADKDSTSTRVG